MTAYTVHLAIAATKNVPSMGYAVAADNGSRTRKTAADLIVATELWKATDQAGFRTGLGKGFAVITHPGQSVALAYDTDVWEAEAQGVIRGGASWRIPLVTDRRDVPWVRLRHIATGRKVILAGVHTSPIPSRKAPWKVPAARASQLAARRRLRRWAGTRNVPVCFAGDFNSGHLMTSLRRFGPAGIVHAEVKDGANAKWGTARSRTYSLRSDHPGVLVSLSVEAAR